MKYEKNAVFQDHVLSPHLSFLHFRQILFRNYLQKSCEKN